jgi:hypothetical protein
MRGLWILLTAFKYILIILAVKPVNNRDLFTFLGNNYDRPYDGELL